MFYGYQNYNLRDVITNKIESIFNIKLGELYTPIDKQPYALSKQLGTEIDLYDDKMVLVRVPETLLCVKECYVETYESRFAYCDGSNIIKHYRICFLKGADLLYLSLPVERMTI